MRKAMTGVLFASMFLCLTSGAMATYNINDDVTGGDCLSIGLWNSISKECILTTDITLGDDYRGIVIYGNNIILNGNGHTVAKTGAIFGPTGEGIFVWNNVVGATIKNLTVSNFGVGIRLESSSYNTVSNNMIINTPSYFGIQAEGGGNNVIANNTIKTGNPSSGAGIRLYLSSGNTIAGNSIIDNARGISIDQSNNNIVHTNYFVGNATQAWVSNSSGNIFNLTAPTGGNYWSEFDSPAEGCNDLNSDTFCDLPYYFTGGIDYLALTAADIDLDTYRSDADCNDRDPAINPAAAEIKNDGIDQDCNGYDLTISVSSAVYTAKKDRLVVEANSAYGATANLSLAGYGPMTWNGNKWTITVDPAGGNPGIVTVSGVEGSEETLVTAR